MVEHFFIYNDKLYGADRAVISPGNRSLRYGDGLFETMKMIKGCIILKEFHFERLYNGLNVLQFDVPKILNRAFFEKKINELVSKNNDVSAARIRLMLFRGNGGIFDVQNNKPNYIIESFPINEVMKLNENGLVVDVFPDARKSIDAFSNLKSNNYLPYAMAGLFAKKNKLNDCIILNSFERICDSVIANVFIIRDNKIYTPPLAEGCVAGTMRRWLLEKINHKTYRVIEKSLTVIDILEADELFLTNSIYHIRWVKSFRDKNYTNVITKEIYKQIAQTIVV
jgi:branched-chain amino acid aminotransferase